MWSLLAAAPALVLPPTPRSCAAEPAELGTPLASALHMFAADPTATVLIGPRACGSGVSTLEQLSDLPLPRLSVVGTPTDSVVDEDIYAFISLMEEIFERPPDERFTVLWDIREGAFPSLRQLKIGFAWLNEDGRTDQWDARIAGNAVLLRNPLLRIPLKAAIAIAAFNGIRSSGFLSSTAFPAMRASHWSVRPSSLSHANPILSCRSDGNAPSRMSHSTVKRSSGGRSKISSISEMNA